MESAGQIFDRVVDGVIWGVALVAVVILGVSRLVGWLVRRTFDGRQKR